MTARSLTRDGCWTLSVLSPPYHLSFSPCEFARAETSSLPKSGKTEIKKKKTPNLSTETLARQIPLTSFRATAALREVQSCDGLPEIVEDKGSKQ